jgi:hypothetical protein
VWEEQNSQRANKPISRPYELFARALRFFGAAAVVEVALALGSRRLFVAEDFFFLTLNGLGPPVLRFFFFINLFSSLCADAVSLLDVTVSDCFACESDVDGR